MFRKQEATGRTSVVARVHRRSHHECRATSIAFAPEESGRSGGVEPISAGSLASAEVMVFHRVLVLLRFATGVNAVRLRF